MKILHINTERGWRGGERQTFWLAREQRRMGHAAWVAARPGEPLAQALTDGGLVVKPVNPLFELDPLSAFNLKMLIRKEGISVVHAHTGHAVGLAALAAAGTAAALVATRRVDFPLKDNRATRWKYGRMDAVAAISRRVRDVLIESGVPPEKITLVPSGIDATGYPSVKERAVLRRVRGLDATARLVVNVGALVPHKDQATLLPAAARVLQQAPDVRFLVFGEGPLQPVLEGLAGSLGIANSIEFMGHRPDVLEWMALADMVVSSSKEEGLGTSLIDALALGVPTVATRAGGVPEIYGGPDAPELVPPQNPEALAAAILQVLREPSEGPRRVSRGFERVREFTVQAMAARYDEIYRKILKYA